MEQSREGQVEVTQKQQDCQHQLIQYYYPIYPSITETSRVCSESFIRIVSISIAYKKTKTWQNRPFAVFHNFLEVVAWNESIPHHPARTAFLLFTDLLPL